MITENEAAESLRDVERVSRRTHVASAYSIASPYLVLWGLVWIAGYTGSGLTAPEQWGWVWLPCIVVGVVGSTILGRRTARLGGSRASSAKNPTARSLLMTLIIMLFMGSVYLVFKPVSPLPYLVFPALIMALTYALIGTFGLPRFTWIGAGIFVAVMLGYLLAPALMPFWIAAAGGGGLVLGGLWMRTI
ncbi:MAG: hypothetical protein ABI471_11630 [Sphingomonas bacterium]